MSDYKDLIADTCDKILLINLKNDTFKEIKVNNKERVNYMGITQWFINFVNSENICQVDKRRFLEFTNINTLRQRLENKTEISFCYQKLINNELIWYLMEILKTDEEDTLLLITKNINQFWVNIEELKYRGKFKAREEITKYIENLKSYGDSCGIIIFEYDPTEKEELEIAFDCYFSNLFEYDDTHMVAIINGYDAVNFQSLLAATYVNFSGYNINIGSAWREDEWTAQEMITAVVTNLQVNRKSV